MFILWLLLFLAFPVLELALLIEVGSRIGTAATIGIVLGTGLVGAAAIRSHGLSVVRRAQSEWRRGQAPAEGLIDGVMAFAGGILLIAPGLITDAIGLVLVVPVTRRAIKSAIRRLIERRLKQGTIRVYFR